MDEGAPIREYSPGDSIQIQLTVEHDFDINEVRARFENQPGDPDSIGHKQRYPDNYTIVLPGHRDQQLSTLHATEPGNRSVVLLMGKVPAGKALGEYRCTRITTKAPGGSWIPFDFALTPEIRFRLIPEPVESPKVIEWGFQR
jgi:hypothetical protein